MLNIINEKWIRRNGRNHGEKNMLKITTLITSFIILILGTPNTSLDFSSQNIEEEKIYCEATMEDEFAEDRVLVVLNEEVSSKSKEYDKNDFSKIRCKDVKELSLPKDKAKNKDTYKKVLSLDLSNSSKEYVLDTIDELIKRDDVLYAGPDYKLSLSSTIPNEYPTESAAIAQQWAIGNINLPKVWDFSTGTNDINVGVIDSGIDGSHPDLANSINIASSRDFTIGPGVPVTEVTDFDGHGTHVAGIIGAIGNNSNGITGVNWNVDLTSLRVMDENRLAYSSSVALAINYAQNAGIRILNMSLGWDEGEVIDMEYYDNRALATVIEGYSGLFICSAGNNGKNTDTNPHYPSSQNISNMISVGAIYSSNEICAFSNYGAQSVQIYAPGDSILSTYPTALCNSGTCYPEVHHSNGYHNDGGTSFAAPHVTGVAALLLSINPELTTTQLKTAILNSAPTITISTPDGNQNVKKLDAFEALKYVFEHYCPSILLNHNTANVTKTIDKGSSYFIDKNAFYELDCNASGQYNFTVSAETAIGFKLLNANLEEITSSVTITNNSDCTKTFSYNFTKDNTYYLRINYSNASHEGTVNISMTPPAHSFTTWKYLNNTSHVEACECGVTGTVTGAHVVPINPPINGVVNCLRCHHKITLDDIVIIPGLNAIGVNQVSLNGSYILSNGIIVLVDEDIEAYLNGTLVFYNKDELPEVA